MGDVKIRYYVTRKAWPGSRARWGYWNPSKAMMAQGFGLVACGEDGPKAWAVAELWNTRWDQVKQQLRRGEVPSNPDKPDLVFPPGSLGEGFARLRRTNAWKSKAKATREDWYRGWSEIEPVFGDVDPRTVSFEDIDLWYGGNPENPEVKGKGILEELGVRESHRVIKIWRAMWRAVGSLKNSDGQHYCDRDKDPSLGIRRHNPKPRSAIWMYDESTVLIDRSWQEGFKGLSAALAVAWDSMLSPVDVRKLTLSLLSRDPAGAYFNVARAKTGKAAIGTLTPATLKRLDDYIASLPFTLMPATPIFHTRGGQPGPKGGRPRPPVPYTKNSLGGDFREIRELAFPEDTRTIADFRRSGAVEAAAGDVGNKALAGKMANTIDTNSELAATYTPATATLVRMADAARTVGRGRLRDAKKDAGK